MLYLESLINKSNEKKILEFCLRHSSHVSHTAQLATQFEVRVAIHMNINMQRKITRLSFNHEFNKKSRSNYSKIFSSGSVSLIALSG